MADATHNETHVDFETFKAELVELLKKHRVMLAPDMYDLLQVWPLKDGDDPLPRGLENCTRYGE